MVKIGSHMIKGLLSELGQAWENIFDIQSWTTAFTVLWLYVMTCNQICTYPAAYLVNKYILSLSLWYEIYMAGSGKNGSQK